MAIALFEQMLELNLGALSLGKWLHRIIAEEDLGPNVYVMTVLIDIVEAFPKLGASSLQQYG
uniref:Uncharacterized protein n=1 Tax=Oryza nivara TaxID=4536 RepID=A0A0E0GLD9_ORYNI